MIFDSFEKMYETNEREFCVLMAGGAGGVKCDNYWQAQSYFLAYIDVGTNKLKKEEGRLTWPLSEEEEQTRDYFKRFRKETIYRIKAREVIAGKLPEGRTSSFYNQLYVTEVLEKNVVCPELEEILAEYRKPVVLKDNVLGELTLNKDLSLFEGHVKWLDTKIIISLDVDKESKSTWTRALKAMKQIVAEAGKWDKDMRAFSAEKLTSLANEWQENEDKNASEISKPDFAGRMSLQSISVTSGGTFCAYFSDDDMFWGHAIAVYGSIKKGIKSAGLEG